MNRHTIPQREENAKGYIRARGMHTRQPLPTKLSTESCFSSPLTTTSVYQQTNGNCSKILEPNTTIQLEGTYKDHQVEPTDHTSGYASSVIFPVFTEAFKNHGSERKMYVQEPYLYKPLHKETSSSLRFSGSAGTNTN